MSTLGPLQHTDMIMNHTKAIELIGYGCGEAAGNKGCSKGAEYLKQSPFLDDCVVDWHWHNMLTPAENNTQDTLSHIASINTQLANTTQALVANQQRFATIGGDHSCGIGSWSGAATALDGPIGLIWVDAHMDAHTFDTSPSNNIHGMPVACLLGHGDPALTKIASPQPKIKPEHLCLVGIRDFEPGEAALLEQLNIRVITIEEVQQKGIEACMQEAINIASTGTVGYGISIDLDGFDPQTAPGVGTPVTNGLDYDAFCQTMKNQTKDNLIGIEIVEFNPEEDHQDKTAKLFKPLIESCFAS
jgi:arginase